MPWDLSYLVTNLLTSLILVCILCDVFLNTQWPPGCFLQPQEAAKLLLETHTELWDSASILPRLCPSLESDEMAARRQAARVYYLFISLFFFTDAFPVCLEKYMAPFPYAWECSNMIETFFWKAHQPCISINYCWFCCLSILAMFLAFFKGTCLTGVGLQFKWYLL